MPAFCPRCNVVMMRDEERVGICEACQRQAGIVPSPPATPPATGGIHTSCEGCGANLGMSEVRLGACPACGRVVPSYIQTLFQSAERAAFGSSPTSLPTSLEPLIPVPPVPPANASIKLIATGLLLVTLVSFLIPFGMFQSMRLAYSKGETVCAYSGCTEEATEYIDYGRNFGFGPGIKDRSAGYCKQHIHLAPKQITVIKRGKSISGLASFFFYIFGPILIVCFLVVHYMNAMSGKPGALMNFTFMSLGTLLLANGLWYAYARWMHYGLQTSGW